MTARVLLAHVLDAVVDPLGLLLQAGGHVAQGRRGGERHGGREQVRVAVHLQAHGGADVRAPIVLERPPAASADVDAGQRAGPGVEPGGQDDDVELVDACRRRSGCPSGTRVDRVVLTLTSVDVVAVVDLQVVRSPAARGAFRSRSRSASASHSFGSFSRARIFSRTNSEISSLTASSKNISAKEASHSFSEPFS